VLLSEEEPAKKLLRVQVDFWARSDPEILSDTAAEGGRNKHKHSKSKKGRLCEAGSYD
jgi:hypothetical protein